MSKNRSSEKSSDSRTPLVPGAPKKRRRKRYTLADFFADLPLPNAALALSVFDAIRRMARPAADRQPLAAARSVMVIRLDRIGDFVLFTPFLRALRKGAPGATITLVAHRDVRPLAEACPYVDNVLAVAPPAAGSGIRRIIELHEFARQNFPAGPIDWTLCPRWDFDIWHGAFLAFFSRALRRAAYPVHLTKSKRRTNRFEEGLFTDIVRTEAEECHEVEKSLRFLEALGIPRDGSKTEVWFTPEDAERALTHLRNEGGIPEEKHWIAVSPSAWEQRKRWPADRFGALIDKLHGTAPGRLHFVLVGGSEAVPFCASLREGREAYVSSVAGLLSLRESAALLHRCRLYIGNDTGPKHIAAAAGVPVVEICRHRADGPEWYASSPRRFGAWGVPGRILQPASVSRIDLVSLESVFEASVGLLAETGVTGPVS